MILLKDYTFLVLRHRFCHWLIDFDKIFRDDIFWLTLEILNMNIEGLYKQHLGHITIINASSFAAWTVSIIQTRFATYTNRFVSIVSVMVATRFSIIKCEWVIYGTLLR